MVSWHDYNLLVQRLDQLTVAIEAIADQQQRIINEMEEFKEHYNEHIRNFTKLLQALQSNED